MEEKAALHNLRSSFSVVNNSSNSITTAANGSLRDNNNSYLYGGGMKLRLMKSHHNWYQSQSRLYEAPSLPQPPLLPLPFSSNSNAALPLPIEKKIKPSSKNNIKKKKIRTKKPSCFPKPATKEVAADCKEEEEEEFFLSPPPSSLPLPRLLLTAKPKVTGATNDLRRLLRL